MGEHRLRILGCLAVLPTVWLLTGLGQVAETSALVVAGVGFIIAIFQPSRRGLLTVLGAGLLLATWLALGWHLGADHFHYRYVWLYSATELPLYLKLANLWGGDEGTLLLLAVLLALLAIPLNHRAGWAGPGALLLAAVFALGAAWWHPFAPTPADDLARLSSQGMNVHLTRIWMALHPPLIFLAYALILAPSGAALEALANGTGAWRELAERYCRTAWLLLSAGLAAGMWWAYEDFTFGQFWHWDPVQTSVFMVWALLTGAMHGLRYYRPDGFLARSLPLLALLAAVVALVSMLITRNAMLASSHRYVGASSQWLLGLVALVLLAATLWALWHGRRLPLSPWRRETEPLWLLRIALLLFVVVAAVAAWQLLRAYGSAWLELPRPVSLQPFFETLARWSQPQELAELRRVFAQWDVDNFTVNASLAPLGLLLGLLGGYAFLPLRRRWLRGLLTLLAGIAALATATWLAPLDHFYHGTGVTSQNTVAIFFWLNTLLVGAAYLTLTAIAWLLRAMRRYRRRLFWRYHLPVALIHSGMMIALSGALSALLLDSYAQRSLRYPDDFGTIQRFADGYAAEFELQRAAYRRDGARIDANQAAKGSFQALGQVRLYRQNGDEPIEIGSGNTLYRDQRAPAAGDKGAVRQLCEILDYRYARYAGDAAYRLDPFIQRGFWRDVQVWLPALDYRLDASGQPQPQTGKVTVVIKTYPLLSWLWIGLVLALLGALLGTLAVWRGSSRPRASSQAQAV